MAANRHATRSPRRARRHSRTARSQRASRRSAAASTGFTKRRGPCRREQTVRTDHGGALDHDAAAAPRRCWAALSAVRDAHSMCTTGREQRRQVPHSKVERRLRLAAPRIQARGDCGQRHRPSSARAHISHRIIRCGGRAVRRPRKHDVRSCVKLDSGPRAGRRGPTSSAWI